MSNDVSLGALSETARARQVLPEADVLLDYVAIESNSIASPMLSDIVRTVIRAREAVDRGVLDAGLARSLLESVATLRVLAQPATAETIATSRSVKPRALTLPALIVTAVTILVTGLASFNAAQQASLLRLIENQNQAALGLVLRSHSLAPPPPGPGQTADASVLATLNEFSVWNRALAEQTRGLRRWADAVGLRGEATAAVTVPSVPAAIEPGQIDAVIRSQILAFQQIREAAVDAVQTNSALAGAANSFVLPELFALLGSMAFGVRKDMEAIRTNTLSPRRHAQSRNTLAVVAGVVIGLFMAPSASANISTLAVAFLAGYGAEIMFAWLDSMVAIVTRAVPRGEVAEAAVSTPQGTPSKTRPDSPARTRVAELAVLTRAVNESFASIFAPPAFIAYSGTLGVEIADEAGVSAVTAHGRQAVVLFPRPGTYQITVWFVPDAAPPQGAATVPLKVEGSRPEGPVPFEVRADLGFATMPLRRQEVAVDAKTPSKIDLGVLQVVADGPVRPDYPLSVTVYQHGQRCTTCVIVPAPDN